MGCCASINRAPSAPHRPPPLPHPSLEEETVKEVLSETPTPKPNISKVEDEVKTTAPKPALHKIEEEEDNNVLKKHPLIKTEEISEVSEIYSTLSESVSTTTVNEKRDGDEDDGEVRQRVSRSPAKFRNRSFSGDLSARRERVGGKSPVRRSQPSPGRVKSLPGREKTGYVPGGPRRDSGESFERRSRSPATRTDGGGKRIGLGQGPNAKRTGKSPGRIRSDMPEKNRKVEEGNREDHRPPTTNESLENPLVSFECFIFL